MSKPYSIELTNHQQFSILYLNASEVEELRQLPHDLFVYNEIACSEIGQGRILVTHFAGGYGVVFRSSADFEQVFAASGKVVLFQSPDLEDIYYFLLLSSGEIASLLKEKNQIVQHLCLQGETVHLLSNGRVVNNLDGDCGELYNNLQEYIEIRITENMGWEQVVKLPKDVKEKVRQKIRLGQAKQ